MLLEEFAMKTNRFSVVLGDEIMIGRRVTDRLLAWLGGNHRAGRELLRAGKYQEEYERTAGGNSTCGPIFSLHRRSAPRYPEDVGWI